MARSYAVGAYFEHFIEAQVKSGRFASASEVLREGLRLLDDREQRRLARLGVSQRDVPALPAAAPAPKLRRARPTLVRLDPDNFGHVDPDDVESHLASLEDRLRGVRPDVIRTSAAD